VQEHILAAIIRRDEAEAPRVVEKFDRPSLAHGKLLSPFQRLRETDGPAEDSVNSKDGERNHDLVERARPIFTRIHA
jgi:hypothetical protein